MAVVGLLALALAFGWLLAMELRSDTSAGEWLSSRMVAGSDRLPSRNEGPDAQGPLPLARAHALSQNPPLCGNSAASGEGLRADAFCVSFQDGKLLMQTQSMVLGIEGGAITYVQDVETGEVLVDAEAYSSRPEGPVGLVGFASQDAASDLHLRRPEPSSSVSCSWDGDSAVRLVYSPLYSGDAPAAAQLIVDLSVDRASGEVVVRATGIEGDASLRPATVDIPIMRMSTPAVILSSGARYARGDAEAVDQTTYPDLGLNSPNMAVVEGLDAVLAVWSETTEFAPEYIQVQHTPAYDHLILHTGQDPKQASPEMIVSSPWRIGTYRTWPKAARRWRNRFEERTGARPLWENRIAWVRNIHAVFDGMSQDYGDNREKYAELAGIADPEKVLYFLWNGDRIVLMGDHTLVERIGRPTPEFLAIVRRYGWPLLLYHPYNLIYSETGTVSRLEFLADKGWLPDGYRFSPDYEGTPDAWHGFWADVRVNHHDDANYYLLHPASAKFGDYLVRNLRNYRDLYQADGAYLDMLGDDNRTLFRDGALAVIEGQDPIAGETNVVARIAEELPGFGVMSEYQGQWLIPFAFYSWEGSVTHIRQNAHAQSRINHPLRTALIGSYTWTRESNREYVDDVVAALMGTLPEVSLVGDYGVSDDRALWSQARAKLFCEEELYNALPPAWADDALAYYRSKSGHWFKFARIGSTYGYIEIMPDGEHVIRLMR